MLKLACPISLPQSATEEKLADISTKGAEVVRAIQLSPHARECLLRGNGKLTVGRDLFDRFWSRPWDFEPKIGQRNSHGLLLQPHPKI